MDDRFQGLIARSCSFAARHPAAYRMSVAAFGAVGYLYLAAMVVLVGAATALLSVFLIRTGVGPVAIRAALPPLLLLLFTISALRAAPVPAEGLVVTRREAPPLHAVIESVRNRLGAPRIHAVLIGTGLDIRVVRMPRLGSVFGFRNCVVIGLPLMAAVPLAQFRALLAHPLAHLCRNRGNEGFRAYDLRDRWLRLAAARPDSRRIVGLALRPFFRGYAPRFAAWSFPVAREHEFAADRQAGIAAGGDELARALVRVGVVERFLIERFWPRLLADLRAYSVPRTGLLGRLEAAVDRVREDERFRAWLDAVLTRDGGPDTHPATRDRLAALGIRDAAAQVTMLEVAFAPALDGEPATRRLLGTASRELLLSVEHSWIDAIVAGWADRHEELVRWDERRRDLDTRTDLSPAEALDQAIATAEISGPDAALPILRELVVRCPDMAPAHFVLGTLLLRTNDSAGLGHVEVAIRRDPALHVSGLAVASEFLRANGRHDDVDAWVARFPSAEYEEAGEAGADDVSPASERLAAVPATERSPAPVPEATPPPVPIPEAPAPPAERDPDGYRHHGLEYPDLLAVKRGIARVAAIARAYLVREPTESTRSLPGRAVVVGTGPANDCRPATCRFLLAVELMRGGHDPAAVAARLARDVKLPGPARIAVLSRRHRKARRALEAVAEAPFFERTRRRSA
jgi:Zn-dependent protease with chaperone function